MKDEYMDNIRKEKGYGKGGPYYRPNPTDNVETSGSPLENLEKTGGFRALCSVECRKPNSHRPNVLSNRFAALESEDEEEVDRLSSPPGLVLSDFIVVKGKREKRPKSQKTVAKPNLFDLDSLEVNTVNMAENTEELTITIDSGASENVISEAFAPQVPVRASQGSREGLKYVAANGSMMPNRGEKHIHVRTSEGHKCLLNMQVTDVKKPLMSVARICDAGHEVHFTKDGGYIEHVESGQLTSFNREDNVYRLHVAVSEPVFSRQGKQ
jgi:hypothetical protein